MTLAAHTITGKPGARKARRRVGRGNSSTKGTYSSRGGKGQRARSGGKKGTQRHGFKQSLQKVKKLRGFQSLVPKKYTITLDMLERVCQPGDTVNARYLMRKGLLPRSTDAVKIVASGSMTKKVTIEGCLVSSTATEAIEKAGGTIRF